MTSQRVGLWVCEWSRGKRQAKKKGKWQEGCLDGNAAAAFWRQSYALGNLTTQALLCAEPALLDTLGFFLRLQSPP